MVRENPNCGFEISDYLELVCKFGRWPENWVRSLRVSREKRSVRNDTLQGWEDGKELAKTTEVASKVKGKPGVLCSGNQMRQVFREKRKFSCQIDEVGKK